MVARLGRKGKRNFNLETLLLAAKERIAMDLEKYGTVRVTNIEVKEDHR